MIRFKKTNHFSERKHDYGIRRTDKENTHVPGLDTA